ncbi:MAG TPA: putative zinc-binding metallopeptidase [Pirellulales bacterium]|nr:putative zinc-binding metallopeptidase [Pirellulales bacterium]
MTKPRRRIRPVARATRSRVSAELYWARYRDEQLLDLRMCDLGLKIEGTVLESRIEQLYAELERRHLRLRPHCWLSEEWFSPDGVPGIAIPFYLAHPRLMKLENRKMLEVEGGTRDWCMRILRHEAGHTIDTAFRLHRRRPWQDVFGKSSQPYPDFYNPKPYSKSYVLHLDSWYAQSHPAEDFAETFAVWLRPDSDWRKRYAGWPALKKLEFVDQLMSDLADRTPAVRSRERIEPLSHLKITLREHYAAKQARYAAEYPDFYDRDLRRLFSGNGDGKQELAAGFLSRIRPEIRRTVAYWTGEYQYTIDQVLQEMISRCRQLKLRLDRPEDSAKQEATILLTVQTMNYLHGGHHRVAL